MKRKQMITIVVMLAFNLIANAQTDTIYGYLSKYNYKTTEQEATYYTKLYKLNNLWHRQKYLIKDHHLEDEADFLEKDCKTYNGFYREYTDSGKLYAEYYYQNNRTMYGTFYHANGTKAGYAEYDTAQRKAIKQQGWDENGNEIPNYTFYKIAEFPGKSQGWIKFLQRYLNADIPTYRGAKAGKYTVILGFFVEPDGTLSDISVLSDPGYGTGAEALRVMRLSVGWTPGIENNKVKRFLYRQPITFQVSDY